MPGRFRPRPVAAFTPCSQSGCPRSGDGQAILAAFGKSGRKRSRASRCRPKCGERFPGSKTKRRGPGKRTGAQAADRAILECTQIQKKRAFQERRVCPTCGRDASNMHRARRQAGRAYPALGNDATAGSAHPQNKAPAMRQRRECAPSRLKGGILTSAQAGRPDQCLRSYPRQISGRRLVGHWTLYAAATTPQRMQHAFRNSVVWRHRGC